MSTSDDLQDLARRAYVYGFPLVFNLEQVRRYVTTGIGANPAAPFNAFSHARTLAGPQDRFVTINNDTVYSMAQLDLSCGALVLEVPDTTGRYYVLQFVSAWTENFAYVGKRATGTAPGRFLLVGPDGERGDDPNELVDSVIRCPTTVVSIVGRWAVTGPEDLLEVNRLQDATTLTALHPDRTGTGVPEADTDAVDDALSFWEQYRTWSQAFAPPGRDQRLQAGFAPLGLTGSTPVGELSEDLHDVLRDGFAAGADSVAQSLRGGHVESVNGWQITLHSFDYNLDHFEIGALDEPRWKMADTAERLVIRAGAALGGLWGNNGYEAAYFAVYVDDTGQPLTGEDVYEVTLDPPPPTGAFWSITMYGVPDYFLVANPIDRYSLGDRTPGVVTGAGGSVTITMCRDEPGDVARRANWLPTPAGQFRPILRVYLPGEAILDGTYTLPHVRRISRPYP